MRQKKFVEMTYERSGQKVVDLQVKAFCLSKRLGEMASTGATIDQVDAHLKELSKICQQANAQMAWHRVYWNPDGTRNRKPETVLQAK